jgi:integrase/recombinase XerD
MLEFYFSYCGVLRRFRSGALGDEMDRIAAHFSELGYKRASAKIYLSRIARFSHFAAKRCGSAPISQEVVDQYLLAFPTESPRIATVSALAHARRVAPERFVVAVSDLVDDPEAPLLASYADYLRKVRGLEPKSCEGIFLGARRFLEWFRQQHPDKGLEAVTAEHVLAAVEDQLSRSVASGTRTSATSHIRAFLRFLHWIGRHDQDLARVVPGTPHWRLAHLPPRLAWEDIRRAIDAIGVTTSLIAACGRISPGILLTGRTMATLIGLLASSGLRSGEAVRLDRADVDLANGVTASSRCTARPKPPFSTMPASATPRFPGPRTRASSSVPEATAYRRAVFRAFSPRSASSPVSMTASP